MKKVSFKVAKAIKEAGYSQDCSNEYWIKFKNKPELLIIKGDEALDFYENISDETDENYVEEYYTVTEYLEVWLWLWREKNIRFDVEDFWNAELSYPERGCACNTNQLGGICTPEVSDPEEAIIAAIEYIVENNLIK